MREETPRRVLEALNELHEQGLAVVDYDTLYFLVGVGVAELGEALRHLEEEGRLKRLREPGRPVSFCLLKTAVGNRSRLSGLAAGL